MREPGVEGSSSGGRQAGVGLRRKPRRVSRGRLEQGLADLSLRVRDPRAGIFGPDSKVWEVNGCSIVFLGAGRAALLQLAHPWVAWAIEHHSKTSQDPFGRFQRTFRQVFAMVFGDLDSALRAARAVHALHERIRGEIPQPAGRFAARTRYFANDPEALLWVHATLWDTSIQVYESVVRRLDASEKSRYYQETKRFATLFGIPDRILPSDWPEFAGYVQRMLRSDALEVTPPAARMARFLLRPPHPWLALPMDRFRLVTAHLLPARLAEAFGLARGGRAGRRRYESTLAWLRRLYPRLPQRLHDLPAYLEACRRIEGRRDRDWLGEQLNRLLVGNPP